MAEIKKLYFSSGVAVTAPTDLGLASSTVAISEYASDAAFVTANGTATAGDVYINSTLKALRLYTGSSWRTVVMQTDAADPTKTFLVDVSTATTGTSATLSFSHTASRIYSYPDFAGIVVLNTNTLTSPTVFAGATGTTTIGNASGTVSVLGNFQVQGTTTTVSSTTLDVTDKNITVSKSGNDAASEGAGLTVDRTGTKGSLIYKAASATKFAIGALASEVDVADISTAQTLTNKTISGASNTISNVNLSSQVTGTLPIGNGGTGQTTANTALNALLPSQAANTNLYLKTDGTNTAWAATSGGGSGSGEINAVTNSSVADNTTGWTNGTSHTLTRVTSGSPLNPVITTALSVAASTTAAESSTSGEYFSFTMPAGLANKKLKVEFYYTTEASQTWNVSVYQSTTRLALSKDVSAASIIPANVTGGKFVAYFDSAATGTYSVNFTRTAGASSSTLIFTSVIVGPDIQQQGAVVTAPQAYTPTFTGFGTVTNIAVNYARIGSSLKIWGSFTTGTPTGVLAKMSLPAGLTVNSTYHTMSQNSLGQVFATSGVASAVYADDIGMVSLYDSTDNTAVYFSYQTNTTASGKTITAQNGNAQFNVGSRVAIQSIDVEISEWAGNGTLSTSQNDLEFASNSSSTDAADTTSFAYGPDGSTGILGTTALTADRKKRIRFTSPIQATDILTIEIKESATSAWMPLNLFSYNSGVGPISYQNSVAYGIGFAATAINSTDIDVQFARYSSNTNSTFGAAGQSWATQISSAHKWRVKKEKAGVAVGFGLASSTASGLAPAQVFGTESGVLDLQEITGTPSNPASSAEAKVYMKSDKLVIQYNDAGTVRYKYLDLTGTGVTWVHTTSAP